jgi:hypothetical protein
MRRRKALLQQPEMVWQQRLRALDLGLSRAGSANTAKLHSYTPSEESSVPQSVRLSLS